MSYSGVQVVQAQTSAPRIYRIGVGGVTAPIVLHKNDPKYTPEARRVAREGTVALSLIVDANGRAQNVQLMRGLGLGLDQQAIQAIRTWRFKPAMTDGKSVSVYGNIDVHFHL